MAVTAELDAVRLPNSERKLRIMLWKIDIAWAAFAAASVTVVAAVLAAAWAVAIFAFAFSSAFAVVAAA